MTSSTRRRVLLAWERGRNLGHAARLSALAAEILQAEADPVWALPADRMDVPLAVRDAIAVRAPLLRSASVNDRIRIRSFADILMAFGFADSCALQEAVSRWLRLFDEFRIDRVVLDYAPAAQLAALVAGLPAVQITNGFDAPPPACPIFGVGMRGPMLDRRNARQVDALDHSIGSIGKAFGRRTPTTLREFLAYPKRWYDCVAETDPYGPRSDGVYVGPIGRPHDTVAADWPQVPADGPRVFVYLRSEHQLSTVLESLANSSCRVVCAWPNGEADAVERQRRPGVCIFDRPIDLSSVLPQADFVVNYGSATLVCQALLAGKPQLMLPSDAEKCLVSRRVARVGAGHVMDRPESVETIQRECSGLLHPSAAASKAHAIAMSYGGIQDRLRIELTQFLASAASPRDRAARTA